LSGLEVALLSEEFPPFLFGGIGAVTFDLARNLSKRKIRTTVFCGTPRKSAIERSNDYLEIVRLPFIDLPPRFLWFQVQNFLNIARHRGRYQLIHSVSHQMAFLSAYLKRKLKIPLITSYHGVPFYDLRAFMDSPTDSWTVGDFGYQFLEFPLNETLVRVGLRNSDKIVVCSRTTLNELSTICRNINLEKSMVIPNGIDLEKIQEIKNRFKKNEKVTAPSIIFAGRLYYYKGITYLLQALEHLIPDYPDLKLNIFGTGPMKNKVQERILNRNLKDRVFLRGQVDRSQLMEEMLAADVAVFPSLREAQPVSVLEAMALEKPVVVFDYSFAREIVRDRDTGFLAKPKDSKELAAKIGIFLSDKKLRTETGQRGYEYVAQHHNWENLVNQYIDLYEAVAQITRY
jgi:glycosyltransferase involved in cell wall biosynthesis